MPSTAPVTAPVNPLLPDPREAIALFEAAVEQLIRAEKAGQSVTGGRLRQALIEIDEADKHHQQALKRVAATSAGRGYLLPRLEKAQEEVDRFSEPTAALGRDYSELTPIYQRNRKQALEVVNTYPQLIAQGEDHQTRLTGFAEQGFGHDAQQVPAAQASRVLQDWGAHQVRYTFGPHRDPRTRRVTKVTRERIYTESLGQEGPSQIALARQHFHQDAAGNLFVADPRMHGGLPYAIYSPIGA